MVLFRGDGVLLIRWRWFRCGLVSLSVLALVLALVCLVRVRRPGAGSCVRLLAWCA
jgi:hypothetical protein